MTQLEIRVEKCTAELSKANEQLVGEIKSANESRGGTVGERGVDYRATWITFKASAHLFKNTQGRFIIIQPLEKLFFRINREEVKGKTDHDSFPGGDGQRIERTIKEYSKPVATGVGGRFSR